MGGSAPTTIIAASIWGTNAWVAEVASGTGVKWDLADHLGSVRLVTNAAGAVVDTVSYDAWGTQLTNTAPSQSDRYGYTGVEYDSVLQLWYDRARIRGTNFEPQRSRYSAFFS